MALDHLDPYRRSRRDAARALARTACRCAAHPSSSPRTSSAPSTASAGGGSATRVLERARTCSRHQSTLDVALMALSKGLIRAHGRWTRLHGAATDHHTIDPIPQSVLGSATFVSSLYVNVHSSHRNMIKINVAALLLPLSLCSLRHFRFDDIYQRAERAVPSQDQETFSLEPRHCARCVGRKHGSRSLTTVSNTLPCSEYRTSSSRSASAAKSVPFGTVGR